MSILKPQQRKALERALVATHEVDDALTFLEEIASVSPQYAERVKALRDRQLYVRTLSERALTADGSS